MALAGGGGGVPPSQLSLRIEVVHHYPINVWLYRPIDPNANAKLYHITPFCFGEQQTESSELITRRICEQLQIVRSPQNAFGSLFVADRYTESLHLFAYLLHRSVELVPNRAYHIDMPIRRTCTKRESLHAIFPRPVFVQCTTHLLF